MKLTLHALLIAATFTASSCKKKVATITPERRDITEVVYASGALEPFNQFTLYSLADGTITEVLAREGDTIGPNQTLLRIESSTVGARLFSSREIYQTARENYGENSPALLELKSQLNTLKNRLINDSTNYYRYKRLYEQNAVKKTDLERAELAYINSKNEYTAVNQRLEGLRSQLYVTLQNAESQYKAAQEDADHYLLKSGMRGRVYDILKKQGEVTRRGEPIALIGDADKVIVRLSVDESDIEKIAVGQTSLVQVDAFGDKIFKAEVSRIYPAMNKKDFAFRVDAVLLDELPAVFPGANLEANIIIQEKKNVLCIPKTVLLPGDSVLVKTGDGEQKVKVQKGIENFEYAEITGGLDDNTQIIKK